jgi:hypothetical protein
VDSLVGAHWGAWAPPSLWEHSRGMAQDMHVRTCMTQGCAESAKPVATWHVSRWPAQVSSWAGGWLGLDMDE